MLYYHKDEGRCRLADDETRRQVKAEHVVAVRNCSRGEVGLQVEDKVKVFSVDCMPQNQINVSGKTRVKVIALLD